MPKKEFLMIQTSKEFKAKVKKAAEAKGSSLSGFIRWILIEYLEEQAKKKEEDKG